MSFLSFLTGRRSAPVARDRLQVLLAHERALAGGADLAAVLREEILAVIARHMPIDGDKVIVKLDRGDQVSTLEIDIEMPDEVLSRPHLHRSNGSSTNHTNRTNKARAAGAHSRSHGSRSQGQR